MLRNLPCALSHPEHADCFGTASRPGLSLIPAYLSIVAALLAGPELEVTGLVKSHTYDAFARALRHHTMGFSEEKLEPVKEVILVGLRSKERGARLASG